MGLWSRRDLLERLSFGQQHCVNGGLNTGSSLYSCWEPDKAYDKMKYATEKPKNGCCSLAMAKSAGNVNRATFCTLHGLLPLLKQHKHTQQAESKAFWSLR